LFGITGTLKAENSENVENRFKEDLARTGILFGLKGHN
jgi:hypothetical protein